MRGPSPPLKQYLCYGHLNGAASQRLPPSREDLGPELQEILLLV